MWSTASRFAATRTWARMYAWPSSWAAMTRLCGSDRTPAIGSCSNGPPVPERRMICVPICSKRFMIFSRASSSSSWSRTGPSSVDALRRHRARADHPRGAGRRALDVAADAGRVLAVEDPLGRHRAERPGQAAHLLVAPRAEALLLLERLMMAERRGRACGSRAGSTRCPSCRRGRRPRGRPRGSRPRESPPARTPG